MVAQNMGAMKVQRKTAIKRGLLWMLGLGLSWGCQFKDRCGEDPLVYRRGLCFEPAPPPADAALDAAHDRTNDAAPTTPEGDSAIGEDGQAAPSCSGVCNLLGRCIADNDQAAPLLADPLAMLGFAGTTTPEGCLQRCADNRAGPGDWASLPCFARSEATAQCDSATLSGALAAVDAVNACCMGRADSEYCVTLCTALQTSPVAYPMVPGCTSVLP